MSVRTDTVNLIVNVNGNTAQNNLNNLRKKANEISFEMKGLVKGTDEYIAKGKELKDVTSEMDALKKQIGITSLSTRELTAELNKLKALRGSVVPFSDEYNTLSNSISEVERRLVQVRSGSQGFGSMLGSLGDSVKQFGLVAAAYLGVEFLKNAISQAGKLSDQLADLRRVSGLTAAEASNLNEQLTKIDTRTSVEALRNIAITAGKLGVAKGDVFGFTEAVDKLVVSLGDELGDADQITTQLGKILNVFDGKVDGDNITRLGNAFVELANAGVASGAFIADFDQRLSGIAKTAGIGLGELSGLGAGLEALGGKVESTSSAVQKLIIGVGSDLEGAAKIAGKSTGEFTKLFKEDATEALIQYSEGLVKNKSSFAEFTAGLKDAGEEGVHTIATLSLLGNNATALRTQVDLGKTSYQESTSITESFRLKNETLGATMEKLAKQFASLYTGSKISEFFSGIAQSLLSVITPAKSLYDEFKSQESIVNKLEKSTLPLIDRYEELKKKSTLNKDEQVELNKAITAIGETIPGAITQFDSYGRSLGINAGEARKFINLQRAILKEKNRDALKDQETLKNQLEREADILQKSVNKGTVTETLGGGTGGVGGGATQIRNFTDQEIRKAQAALATYQERLAGIKGIIDELKGDNLKLPETIKPDVTPINVGGTGPVVTDEQKKTVAAALKKQESDYDRLLKESDDFYKQIQLIKEKAVIKGESPQQSEVDAVALKYGELLKKAQYYYTKLAAIGKADKSKLTKEELLIEEAYQVEITTIGKKFIDLRAKEELSRNDDNYKAAIASQANNAEQFKNELKKQYADGLIDKKEYEDALLQLSNNGRANDIETAAIWALKSKQAAKDLIDFKKKQEIEFTDLTIAEREKRTALSSEEKAAQLIVNISNTRPGSKSNLNANKAQLEAEKQLEIQAAKDKYAAIGIVLEDSNAIIQEINERYRQKNKDADDEYLDGIIDKFQKITDTIASIWSSINQILVNRENADLARDKANNDKKKKTFKDQLDKRLISKEQYDKKVNQLDEEQDKKQKEIQRKQAIREKALNLFNAITSTAVGIARAIPNIPLMALAALIGGLQIAAIANTPIPQLGSGDWVRNGAKHKDKEGGIPVMIERDEAVISAAAMTNQTKYTVTGTTAQITSALNGRTGGANWAGGALLQMPAWRTERPATINPNMARVMEQGGIVRPLEQNTTTISTDELATLMQIKASLDKILDATKDKADKLHAVVSIKEFDQQKALYDSAKKASGIK